MAKHIKGGSGASNSGSNTISGRDSLTGIHSPAINNTVGSRTIVHLPNSTTQNDVVPSFGAVLRKYRNKNELSQPELAEMLGISRNTITNWETDKCRPEVDSIRTLCTMLGIPLYELFGLSNDSIPSPHENVILSQYRQLSPVGRRVIDKTIHSMLEEETNARDNYLEQSFDLVPLESTPSAAGPGCDFVDQPPEYVFIKKNGYSESVDALIRVSGASMEPTYHDGDLVYVKYTQDVADGDIVICSTADGAVIKQLMNDKLHSLNIALPYGDKNEDDRVTIVGKVLGRVGTWDLANEEDVPALEEVKAADVRAFKQKYGLL